MSLTLSSHFSHALKAHEGWLHMAAHSHHLWPDVTRTAQLQAWETGASHADRKWDIIFREVLPTAQHHIARQLHLPHPHSIAFAPNTHEFVTRLLSCLPTTHTPRILTTDSEFHSAHRQFQRLEEDGLLSVTRIHTEPFHSFPQRFAEAASQPGWDMVFFSQVFFNSGHAIPSLPALVNAIPSPDTLIVIDGYHGFMALPTDLSPIAHRAFYMAGGYKYAMAGEGACFLHVPPHHTLYPRNTGWYAAFGALEAARSDKTPYAPHGAAFLGATFDPSGLYRFNAVQHWLSEQNLSVDHIHHHVASLQQHFLTNLSHPALPLTALVAPDASARGHFLTFDLPHAATFHQKLMQARIVTDVRGTRLRFGFGLYHTSEDITLLLHRLQELENE